jgi:putative tryptophan/tyrosine transport system substrate-binding protein
MRRRDLIKLIAASATCWPLAARPQQPVMPVIGLLSMRSLDDPATVLQMVAFRGGLKEAGFEEGRNVAIEYRWAAGHYERLPGYADDLVRRKVAVIVAHAGSNAIVAAKEATATVPIVFIFGGDPVEFGFVASLNRPAGNITGATVFTVGLAPKLLELLAEIIPNLSVIGFICNPTNTLAETYLRQLQDAARAIGRQLVVANASAEGDFEPALANLAQQRVGGVVIMSDPLFHIHIEQLAGWTARHMIPAVAAVRGFPAAGGLMSYGSDFNDTNRVAGEYVGRILKGAKPADLPVQVPTKFDLVINLRTAKALGLTVPLRFQQLADEVIE